MFIKLQLKVLQNTKFFKLVSFFVRGVMIKLYTTVKNYEIRHNRQQLSSNKKSQHEMQKYLKTLISKEI